MITTIIIYMLSLIIETIAIVLPVWQIWPQNFLDGLNYFFSTIATLNFILPIDTFFTIILFFVSFEVAFFTSKIVLKVFNYFRGTGSGIDI